MVSDYTSVQELIAHSFAADGAEAAALALTAGVDMEMVSRLYNQHGTQLLKEKRLSMAVVDDAVRRVLRIKHRLGLFEHPYGDESVERATLLRAEHLIATRELAARSFVLLKNNSETLPISKELKSIAVIGPLADDAQSMIGSWSGDGRKEDAITLLAGIRAKLSPTTKITHARGCEVTGDAKTGFDQALQAARVSDFIILAVGETADLSGEAACRTSLDLPGAQLELLQNIHALGKPYAVVLMNGRPLSINWVAQHSPAILETWFAGTQAGHAIADVLFGDVNPGGKLPVTFPRTVGQVPIYYNHKSTGRPPDPANKYSSKYLDAPWTPLYPFGHGLSFTQFKLSDVRLSARRIAADEMLTVSVDVQNTGRRAGDEVVQLYLHDVAASVTRPVKELKGFHRISLPAGGKQRVQFALTPKELGFYNREMKFTVEPGLFKLFVGTSSEGGIETGFEVVRN